MLQTTGNGQKEWQSDIPVTNATSKSVNWPYKLLDRQGE